jgi:predicted HicB family RNase H-like nuclease
MWWLSHKEVRDVLRESEEQYLREFKAAGSHDRKRYSHAGIFVTREIREKLNKAMKKKYERS